MTNQHAEQLVLGAALAHGRKVPVGAMALRVHRDIASALDAVDLRGDVLGRVERVAEELKQRERWSGGYTGHASWSTLSGCVLAADFAGDDVVALAVTHVQDAHRRRVLADTGSKLISAMTRGHDIARALRAAQRVLRDGVLS